MLSTASNEIGLACLDPRWAGGHPRLLSDDDEAFVIQTATTRPVKLGQPFTRWSIRKLTAYLRKVHGRVIRIGRKALRMLLKRHGITFQRTKTWKESTDPDFDARLESAPGHPSQPATRRTYAVTALVSVCSLHEGDGPHPTLRALLERARSPHPWGGQLRCSEVPPVGAVRGAISRS